MARGSRTGSARGEPQPDAALYRRVGGKSTAMSTWRSAHGLFTQRSARERLEQALFGGGQMDPRRPVVRPQDDHLPIMIGRHVRSRPGRQKGEVGRAVRRLPPQAGDAQEWRAAQGKPVLGLRGPVAGEFEEGGSRNEAAPRPAKSPAFAAEIEHGPAPGLVGEKPQRMAANSTPLPAARITGAASRMRTLALWGKFASFWPLGNVQFCARIRSLNAGHPTSCS